jgi:hypothetical protein
MALLQQIDMQAGLGVLVDSECPGRLFLVIVGRLVEHVVPVVIIVK